MHKNIFLNGLVYYVAGAAAVLYALSYFFPGMYRVGGLLLWLLLLAILVDLMLLYGVRRPLEAKRSCADRFSIGDDNKVQLWFRSRLPFRAQLRVIDELPVQFQERNFLRKLAISSGSESVIHYDLRPVSRGEYEFGQINVFVKGPLGLVKRRIIIPAEQTIKVYPSYMQMRRYHLLALSNRLQDAGVKKLRRLGHSMEFEQIREYVPGDDYRTINWKATARKEGLMVNNYTDERSQQIYCLVNKGRVMKMPFLGMTLLEHAINASLVLSNVALVKQDRAGLICFGEQVDAFVAADKKASQMGQILEALYRQKTGFKEPDFERLYSIIRTRITQRSLLVLFTNFESVEALQREMPALRRIARYHLLLVVFFENTELKAITQAPAQKTEDIYIKTIAEKFVFEKKLMVKELHNNGIPSILTTPENLTVNTINKYLELKTRTVI